MEWTTFIDVTNALINALIAVRVSDNVLDNNAWQVDVIKFKNGRVVSQVVVHKGIYGAPNMLGWSLIDFKDWSSEDWSGSNPENYNEHKILFK